MSIRENYFRIPQSKKWRQIKGAIKMWKCPTCRGLVYMSRDCVHHDWYHTEQDDTTEMLLGKIAEVAARVDKIELVLRSNSPEIES